MYQLSMQTPRRSGPHFRIGSTMRDTFLPLDLLETHRTPSNNNDVSRQAKYSRQHRGTCYEIRD